MTTSTYCSVLQAPSLPAASLPLSTASTTSYGKQQAGHHGTVGPDGLVVDVPVLPGGDGLLTEVLVAPFNFVDQ